MRGKIVGAFCAMAAVLLAVSCNPNTYKNVNYFQDVAQDSSWTVPVTGGIIIQPKDQISIIVSSGRPELAAQFNLPVVSYQAGSESAGINSGYQRLVGYVVDNEGYIEFPVLGRMHVAGLSRWELSAKIKDQLRESGMLTDAVVTVEFMNFKVSVLGEVNIAGTFSVNGDKLTVLEALAMAHDMTIYGRRDNVMVLREQDGKRQMFVLDLTDTAFMDSPAFYLQQNDMVYVTPNKVRAGQSTINQNNVKSVGFWVTIGNVALTAANFIATLSR